MLDTTQTADELRAKAFATRHHAAVGRSGQLRKYTGESYLVHPQEVANIVRSIEHTSAMISAAWSHELLEDTGATADEIRHELGSDVLDLVRMLTKISKPQDGNRAKRVAIDRDHFGRASADGKSIKLADNLSNTRTIVDRDPAFAAVYLPEKLREVEVLRGGDQTLWQRAYDQVTCEIARLPVQIQALVCRDVTATFPETVVHFQTRDR